MNRGTLLLASGFVLVLTACSDDHGPMDMTASTPATVAEGAGYTTADTEFAQGMIAHHEQAIEMAEIALDPAAGARAEVVDLAGRIQAAQDPEIEQMTAWLTSRGMSVAMDMSDGHDMSAMPGMMSDEDMERLPTLAGPDFDTAWLEMMIAHHEGAVEQAKAVLAAGSDAELAALAHAIIAAQEGEIAEMQALLES